MAWGRNQYGQLGNGTTTDTNLPAPVSSLSHLIAVSAGVWSSFAVDSSGTAWGWGSNSLGHLGNGTNTDSYIPVQVNYLADVVKISTGEWHTLAILSDSTVWAWGNNGDGELGIGSVGGSSWNPLEVNNLTGIIAVAAGKYHSIVLKSDSTVWAFGDNMYGQLGIGNTGDKDEPVMINSLTGIISISVGVNHSLALRYDGTVYAWGQNIYGELGNGTNTDSDVPVQVNFLTNCVAISAGAVHSVALRNDGTAWSWGWNLDGTLGNGGNTDSNVPVQVSFLTNIDTIIAGGGHSLSVNSDGSVWSWGYNGHGQLGNGSVISSNVPVEITGLCPVVPCHSAFTLVADTVSLHHYWVFNEAIGSQPLSYYWSWGDGTFDSIAYPSHTYADSGFYTICLSIYDSTGCSDSICMDYTLLKLVNENSIVQVDVVDSIASIPTELQKTDVLQSWSIYPNPASGNSFVSYTLLAPATLTITLFDILGNELQQLMNANAVAGKHSIALDLSNRPNGVYLLQIHSGDQIETKKVIVMN